MATQSLYYGYTKPGLGDSTDLSTFNAMVDDLDAGRHVTEVIVSSVVHRIIYNYNTASYPPRTAGLAPGCADYVGPVSPTDGLDPDTWMDNS